MVEPRPIDIRDRYLDALSQAQAQGRVEPGQFAARVDAILGATSQAQLDDALTGLRPQQRPMYGPPPAPMPRTAPPQPVRPPAPRRGWDRRDAFVVGGSALFMALFGVGVTRVIARERNSHSYNPASPAAPTSFFERGALMRYIDGTVAVEGTIGEIIITSDAVAVVHKTTDDTPKRTWVRFASGSDNEPVDALPKDTFVSADVSFPILEDLLENTAQTLKLPVTRAVVRRAAGVKNPHAFAWVNDRAYAEWDAATNELVKVVRG